MPRILAFAGSTRRESFNKRLIQNAAQLASDAGADVTVIDLRDYPLPLYDQDLEDDVGFPENVGRLAELFQSNDALLVSSPEYNSSIPAVLKNVIDWLSRPRNDGPMLAAFQGKVLALCSASPGRLGGMRGLVHVRSICSAIGMLVLPEEVSVPSAFQVFDENGQLTDERTIAKLQKLTQSLVQTTDRLQAG